MRFDFDTPIWKMIPDPRYPQICLELRDLPSQSLCWEVLDITTSKRIKVTGGPAQDWTSTVHSIRHPHLILYGFEHLPNMGHPNVVVYNFVEGKVVETFESFRIKEVDFEAVSGDLVRDDSVEKVKFVLPSKPAHCCPPPVDDSCRPLFPSFHVPPDPLLGPISQLVGMYESVVPQLGVEYLEWKHHSFIGYFVKKEGNFARYLLWIAEEAKVRRECTATESVSASLGSFLIAYGKLVFVENVSSIHVLTLD